MPLFCVIISPWQNHVNLQLPNFQLFALVGVIPLNNRTADWDEKEGASNGRHDNSHRTLQGHWVWRWVTYPLLRVNSPSSIYLQPMIWLSCNAKQNYEKYTKIKLQFWLSVTLFCSRFTEKGFGRKLWPLFPIFSILWREIMYLYYILQKMKDFQRQKMLVHFRTLFC